jgi:hypothetical protein
MYVLLSYIHCRNTMVMGGGAQRPVLRVNCLRIHTGACSAVKPLLVLRLGSIPPCAAQVCTFFIDCQSLRELRTTSVIKIAIAQKRCVCEGLECDGLIVFSQRGGNSKSLQHICFPPPSPPHASPINM